MTESIQNQGTTNPSNPEASYVVPPDHTQQRNMIPTDHTESTQNQGATNPSNPRASNVESPDHTQQRNITPTDHTESTQNQGTTNPSNPEASYVVPPDHTQRRNITSTDHKEEVQVELVTANQKLKKYTSQATNYKRTSLVFFILSGLSIFLRIQFSLSWPTWTAWVFGVLCILMFIAASGTQVSIQKAEDHIEQLQVRQRYRSLLDGHIPNESDSKSSYFDALVEINIENLGAYYSMIKSHTNNSYLISAITGVVGFCFIIVGLGLEFFVNSSSSVALISAGAGIIVEFIAAIFFVLYSRTITQLKAYHHSLLDAQNVLLSFKIVEDTSSEDVKAQMMTQMLNFLMSKSSDPNA